MSNLYTSQKRIDLDLLFFLVCVIISCFLIYFFPNGISGDQNCIIHRLSFQTYPSFTDGIVTISVIEIYNNLVNPPLETQNLHIRIFTLICYTFPAFLMAKAVLKRKKYLFIFIILLFSSRYPMLWLSRELFIGTFLFLAITGFVRKWDPYLLTFLIFLCGHAKPEMIIVALVFFIILIWQQKENKMLCLKLFILFAALNILILWPQREHFSLGRSFFSFGQHYSALFHKHQSSPLSDPFVDSMGYMDKIFPKADTMMDVIKYYPMKYYDFLFLSIAHGIKRFIVLFHVLSLFFFIIIPLNYRKGSYRSGLFEKLFLISLIGILPLIMFSFPHIRYLARYYPVATLFILAFLENCQASKEEMKRYDKIIILAVLFNILLLILSLPQLNSGNFWFPD